MICLLLNSSSLFAKNFCQEPTQSTNTTRLHRDDIGSKPRTIESWVDCYYFNGTLSFDSFDDISDSTIIITDEATGQTNVFYLQDMGETISIALSTGSYKIVLRTFDGQVFEGVLTL